MRESRSVRERECNMKQAYPPLNAQKFLSPSKPSSSTLVLGSLVTAEGERGERGSLGVRWRPTWRERVTVMLTLYTLTISRIEGVMTHEYKWLILNPLGAGGIILIAVC